MTRVVESPQDRTDRLLSERRWCYYIDPLQGGSWNREAETLGFIPSLVIKFESGHRPMLGQGEGAAPWRWGPSLAGAEATCRAVNAERGISEDEAFKIVASSMGRRPQ